MGPTPPGVSHAIPGYPCLAWTRHDHVAPPPSAVFRSPDHPITRPLPQIHPSRILKDLYKVIPKRSQDSRGTCPLRGYPTTSQIIPSLARVSVIQGRAIG